MTLTSEETNNPETNRLEIRRLDNALEMLTNGVLMGQTQLDSFLTTRNVTASAKLLSKDLAIARRWCRNANVLAMGIGRKTVQGEPVDLLSLKIFVREKLPPNKIDRKKLAPPELNLPGIGTVVTDLVPMGPLSLDQLLTRQRPALCGYSIGHCQGGAGTIGCFVYKCEEADSANRKVYILSNYHVLANSGNCKQQDSILQPAAVDGGTIEKDMIAPLYDWVRLSRMPFYLNQVDAAIAGPLAVGDWSPTIPIIELIPGGVRSDIPVGLPVRKVGRTTGLTMGTVEATNVRLALPYGNETYMFKDLVICTPYSSPGDSGSLILDEEGLAVGLHVGAAAAPGPFSIFCPLILVLDSLGIELITAPV